MVPSLSTKDLNKPSLRGDGICSKAATKLNSNSIVPVVGFSFRVCKDFTRRGITDSIVCQGRVSSRL